MQVLLPTIEKMLETGMSHREIEAELGLEGDRPVHNLLKRQRRKAAGGNFAVLAANSPKNLFFADRSNSGLLVIFRFPNYNNIKAVI